MLYRNDFDRLPSDAQFLGRDPSVVRALLDLSGTWLEKLQCQDLFNINIDTNRFYRVSRVGLRGLEEGQVGAESMVEVSCTGWNRMGQTVVQVQ